MRFYHTLFIGFYRLNILAKPYFRIEYSASCLALALLLSINLTTILIAIIQFLNVPLNIKWIAFLFFISLSIFNEYYFKKLGIINKIRFNYKEAKGAMLISLIYTILSIILLFFLIHFVSQNVPQT